ncbi:MAG: DUF4364 family protein [Clostridiales bacterium]|nr:DUF4364 family protein [Clostridiales bacterium]
MAELDARYRVMVLHILSRVDGPVTNNQLVNYVLDNNVTNYFSVQLAISDLLSSGFITAEHTHNDTRYHLTEEGRHTYELLGDKVNTWLREDIDSYFKEHKYELKQQTSVYADYMKAVGGGYLVRCQVKNNEKPVIDLNLTVPTREQAQAVCANWDKGHVEVYAAIMDALLK